MQRQRDLPVMIIVRKKKHHHAGHGGAWKVAFADFMTGMFALFLVLWLVNQSSDVKSAIAGYFSDPLGRANEHGSSILAGEGAQAASYRLRHQSEVNDLRRTRLEQLGHQIDEKLKEVPDLTNVQENIEISVTDDGLRIELIENATGIFFQTGRPTPSENGHEILALLGSELGALSLPVRIEGHTDAYPFRTGNNYSNWELSADRANSARRILTEHGLPIEQVASVTGLADRDPRIVNDPFDASNRRITITMLWSK